MTTFVEQQVVRPDGLPAQSRIPFGFWLIACGSIAGIIVVLAIIGAFDILEHVIH